MVTDSKGRADTTLILGSSAGENTVEASVSGISDTITFTATGLTQAYLDVNIVSSIRTEGDLII